MSGESRTQGTDIYVLDTTIKAIKNVADIGEYGPSADDIETTNLKSTGKENLTGLPDNGEVQLQINVDDTDPVHQFLLAEAGSGNRFQFAICSSHGTTAPTVASGVIVPPAATSRTTDIFTASVKTFRGGAKANDAKRRTVTLRISGGIATTWYDPA